LHRNFLILDSWGIGSEKVLFGWASFSKFRRLPTAAKLATVTGKTANKFHIHRLVGTLALINRV
jgi:hypothetical protein